MADSRSHNSTPPLRRARVACKACNARRVKCDANSGQPCWHCRIRDLPCELIESRRGKYTRKRKASQRSQVPANESPCSVVPGDSLDTSDNTNSPFTQCVNAIERLNIPQDQQNGGRGTQSAGTDSAGLRYTLEVDYTPHSGSTERLRVHYPIPAAVADGSAFNQGPAAGGAVHCPDPFFMPARHVTDGLIRAFFEDVHPAYPVYDRRSFMQLYPQGKASPLVLQTIFFLGFTDQKDTCYWVGCATNVAQALGMHRSSQPGMGREVLSLRKRIWWAIYTRDRHTAAAFGQPCRIRDEDCDVEPLTEDDFQFDNDYDQILISAQRDFQVSYVIEMSKLAMILGDILVGEFSPRRPALGKFDTRTLANRLAEWELHLPDQLREPPPHGSSEAMFWARMLYMSYHNYHILLFRPNSIEDLSPTEAERDTRVRAAADSITRIAEDNLATETIWPGQIHLYAHESLPLENSWPVRIWYAKAFVNLMRRLTGRGGSIVNVSSSIARNRRGLAASGSPSTCTDSNATSSDLLGFSELNTLPAYFSFQHAHDPQMPDQPMYDSFIAGYLDSTFDPDLLLYNSLEPLLPLSVEELSQQ
ncbi:hypothetical protein BDW72DRAFT_203713 [Aspergillus terricola var. indicus]